MQADPATSRSGSRTRGTSGAGSTITRLAKHVELAIEPLELSLPQYRALAVLAEGTSMSSVLANRLAVKKPSVTAVIDGLVARGLVERRSDPSDRRRTPLVLTDAGTALVREANRAIDDRLAVVLAALGDASDVESAVAGLEVWRRGLDIERERRLAERAASR